MMFFTTTEQINTNDTWNRAQVFLNKTSKNLTDTFANFKNSLTSYYFSTDFSLINIYKKIRQSSFQYVLVGMLLIYVILYIYNSSITTQSQQISIDAKHLSDKNSSQLRRRRGPPYLTYIISISIPRYNRTRNNIEVPVPKFFNIKRRLPVSRNDSRMYRNNVDEAAASLMLTFIDLWGDFAAQSDSEYSENDWMFIFEDDVNVVPNSIIAGFYPKIFPRWNYTNPNTSIAGIIEQGLDMAKDDGIIYLGTCGAEYPNNSQIYYSYDGLFEYRRGAYFCTHAVAFTKWRARTMWGELAVYRMSHGEMGSDTIARQWMYRAKKFPLSIASNIHWPPGTGHFGFFFQDRGAVPSTRG